MTHHPPAQPWDYPGAEAGRRLWVPNWPSTAVTCGIPGQLPSGMIVGRGGTTAVSDLPTGPG
ncbi:MAG: hypothetical protein LC749_04660, partial [Actinobacteria bacterium]|nr:hypothetical protein [Actinomycetota bacterium]